MPPLYGYLKKWDPYPDWLLRYDFAVKSAPQSVNTPEDSIREHSDKTGAPMLYYHVNAQRRSSIWSLLTKARTPFYFAAFAYRDDQLLPQVISRQELVAAFERLVGSWEDIYSTAINLTETYNRASDLFSPDICTLHDRTFCNRVERITERLVDLQERMHWAADFFAQYLDFLSDVEERRQLPRVWNRYPGRLSSSPFLRKERQLTRIKDGTIDDFVFRAARRINGNASNHPRVQEARDSAVSLIEEMLVFTDTPESEWHMYHPDRRLMSDLNRRRLVDDELWWVCRPNTYGVEDPVYAQASLQPECCHCGGPVRMVTEMNGLPGVYDPPYVLINDKTFVPLPPSPSAPPAYAA